MQRRDFLASLASSAFLASVASRNAYAAEGVDGGAVAARLSEIERAAGGRLGVHILDTASGRQYGYRSDERFMLLSTFKLLACALVLQRCDAGAESLERRIVFSRRDLVVWSPVTERHADGPGMTLAELCAAALTASDNTAGNLILASFGGPPALTAYARGLGDGVTRLDRREPELNVAGDDPLLDTTSPRAMLATLQRLLFGDALGASSRQQLQRWLLANTTGATRLKAGLPGDWAIGDKTGGNPTCSNDVGVLWPPGRAPWLVTAYLAECAPGNPRKDAALAAVGRLVTELAG